MATTGMPTRAFSWTGTLPPSLTPISTPPTTRMPILRRSRRGETIQSTMTLEEMSSTGIASIIRTVTQAGMPRLALQQSSIVFTNPTELRVTAHISHSSRVKLTLESINTNLDRHQVNDTSRDHNVVAQQNLTLYVRNDRHVSQKAHTSDIGVTRLLNRYHHAVGYLGIRPADAPRICTRSTQLDHRWVWRSRPGANLKTRTAMLQ